MNLFRFLVSSKNQCNTGNPFVDNFMNMTTSGNVSGKRIKGLAISARDLIDSSISEIVDRDISAISDEAVSHSLRSFNKPIERTRLLEMVYKSEAYENLHDAIKVFLLCACEDDNERNFFVNLARTKGQKINTLKEYEDLCILSFLYLLAVHLRYLLSVSKEAVVN